MGQLVVAVRVTTVLADNNLRCEGFHQLRHDGVEGPEPTGIRGASRQRDVDCGACCVGSTNVVGEPGPGEKRQPCFVQGDCQYPGVVPKDAFGAIAVVRVNVYISHLGHTGVK